jgi:hypothetical protein
MLVPDFQQEFAKEISNGRKPDTGPCDTKPQEKGRVEHQQEDR